MNKYLIHGVVCVCLYFESSPPGSARLSTFSQNGLFFRVNQVRLAFLFKYYSLLRKIMYNIQHRQGLNLQRLRLCESAKRCDQVHMLEPRVFRVGNTIRPKLYQYALMCSLCFPNFLVLNLLMILFYYKPRTVAMKKLFAVAIFAIGEIKSRTNNYV